ncbi:ImmA/IrrE family metallo-endopeptidase [Companilactobacillus furfuricola]|uniref:ImmA/IrrE family metallo-endopeptidase n=1 Tax=Companilactobacillus furfuricola TaxID=1462575 RepID=UPI00319E4130
MKDQLKLANLNDLRIFNPNVSYRNTDNFNARDKTIINSNVVVELAMAKARNATDTPFQPKKLKQNFSTIKKFSTEDPEDFYPKLRDLLLNCGVVLVALPNLKNARLNGATKKFKNGSVMLLITDKNKKSDIFWFSLIHELGHIYEEDFNADHTDKENYEIKEKRADDFASEFFIPKDKYDVFVSRNDFSANSVKKFAHDLGINPSIVVGRLQNDEIIGRDYLNRLRTSYEIIV